MHRTINDDYLSYRRKIEWQQKELSRLIEIKKKNEFPFSKDIVAKYYDIYLDLQNNSKN